MASPLDLDQVLSTPIDEPIDKDTVHSILSNTPFVTIQGTFNARDISSDSSIVRPGYIFRTGSIERLGEESYNTLHNLGIKAMFDLRSLQERRDRPDPVVPGIEAVWQPSTTDNEIEHQTFQAKVAEGVNLDLMYSSLLDTHQPSLKAVLHHILEQPNKPFLFHCTAGKDRTGVVAAIILSLAGAPIEEIQRDYALSRVGIEPVREFLMTKVAAFGKVDLSDPKVQAAGRFPPDAMKKFFQGLQEPYGGVDSYVTEQLGFTEGELEQIRKNLKSN